MAQPDGKSMTVAGCGMPKPSVLLVRSVLNDPSDTEAISDADAPGEPREEEERVIATMALHAAASQEPHAMTSIGPSLQWGPTRYIGTMRPIHLYVELEAWVALKPS